MLAVRRNRNGRGRFYVVVYARVAWTVVLASRGRASVVGAVIKATVQYCIWQKSHWPNFGEESATRWCGGLVPAFPGLPWHDVWAWDVGLVQRRD